jgi:hypothetical protein
MKTKMKMKKRMKTKMKKMIRINCSSLQPFSLTESRWLPAQPFFGLIITFSLQTMAFVLPLQSSSVLKNLIPQLTDTSMTLIEAGGWIAAGTFIRGWILTCSENLEFFVVSSLWLIYVKLLPNHSFKTLRCDTLGTGTLHQPIPPPINGHT